MTATAWVRFQHEGRIGFGKLHEGQIEVHDGELFGSPRSTGRTLALAQVSLLAPLAPGKILALWNNFGELAAKLGLATPAEPLYFMKSSHSVLAPGGTIRKPRADVKVVFEGELGIVIGRTASGVSEADALQHVFGYTCANDVTAVDVLKRDPTFDQWTRAKGHDTFCPLGPAIVTGLDPAALRVRTVLNGDVRQDFPLSDMRFSVAQLVSLISQDMTLYPGDMILSGTSVGVGSMKPGSTVEVEIPGIGRLVNRYE